MAWVEPDVAVEQDGEAIRHAHPNLKNTLAVAVAAVRQTIDADEDVGSTVKTDPEYEAAVDDVRKRRIPLSWEALRTRRDVNRAIDAEINRSLNYVP